ncbi:MAG: LacI family DNA-binding transcriptional regulator [Thermoguttaceae bacterium]
MARLRPETRMVDVAKAAGCSRAAVTHVLTGAGQGQIRVSDEKARFIRKVARQLNFHPNHAAQLLKGKQSMTLGLISANWREPLHLRAFYWLQILSAARGYHLLTAQCLTTEETQRTVQQFRSRGIDGAMVFADGREFDVSVVRKCLAELPLLVSLFGRSCVPGATSLEIDEADGVRQAVEHLLAQGRRKIALLLEEKSRSATRRRNGFIRAHEHLGKAIRPEQIFIGTKTWLWSQPDLHELVDVQIERLVFGQRIDALIASNDYVAAFLIQGLTRRGLCVPRDVAVVGFENDLVTHHTNPPLTTIHFPVHEVAEAVVNMLAEAAANGGDPKRRILQSKTFQPRLMIRGTS